LVSLDTNFDLRHEVPLDDSANKDQNKFDPEEEVEFSWKGDAKVNNKTFKLMKNIFF
jgi:hypothetical protein